MSVHGLRVLLGRALVEWLGLLALTIFVAFVTRAVPDPLVLVSNAFLAAAALPASACERRARATPRDARAARSLLVAAAAAASAAIYVGAPFVEVYARQTWAAGPTAGQAEVLHQLTLPASSSVAGGPPSALVLLALVGGALGAGRALAVVVRLERGGLPGAVMALALATLGWVLVLGPCCGPSAVLAFALTSTALTLAAWALADWLGSLGWGWPDSRSDDALWHS